MGLPMVQLPETPAPALGVGNKRKFSEEARVQIDLTDISKGRDMLPVTGIFFYEDCDRLLTSTFKVSIEELVVCDRLKNGKGPKRKEPIQRLSIAYRHPQTGKVFWKCISPACKHLRAGNRQLGRIIMHAMDCPHLPADLKDLANDTAIEENASGAKVNPKQVRADPEDHAPLHKKVKTIQNTLIDVAVTTGKVKYEHAINLRLVELFCVRAIPAKVLDTPEWKKFVEEATKSKYNPPSSTTFTEKLIPAEAALVRSYQIKFLDTCINLTLTFDGAATRKPSSVYTVHVTTADRETFFMEGCDATDERHTAEFIEGLVTKVCD